MLEEWIRNWKAESGGKNWFSSKQSKYLLVIIICFGILALLWPVAQTDNSKSVVPASSSQDTISSDTNQRMSSELEGILSKISGAGQVDVSLTLVSDGVKSYATNDRNESRIIEEKDAKGSNKLTREENITHDLATSGSSPLLLEARTPEVIGVLLVAEGASDAGVRENLRNATATLLNIPVYKVRVLPREGRK